MKKEMSIREFLNLMEVELEIDLSNQEIGEIYENVKTAAVFEDYQDYEEVSSCTEGDFGLNIACNKETAIELIKVYEENGRLLNLELITEKEIITEDILNSIGEKNTLYLTSFIDILTEINLLKQISRKTSSEILISLEDADNPDFTFEADLFNGTIKKIASKFDIKFKDRDEFYYKSNRMLEMFQNSTILELENINITIALDGDVELKIFEINGETIIKDYLFGKNKDLFNDKEKLIEVIKDSPTIMSVAPEQIWKDKSIVLDFVCANNRNLEIINQERMKDEEKSVVSSSRVIKSRILTVIKNTLTNPLPKGIYFWLSDNEIFDLIFSSCMIELVQFDKESYNESLLTVYLEKNPRLIRPILDYWLDVIDGDYKTNEHIKRKYKLNDKTKPEDLAYFKCYEMLEKFSDKVKYLKYLLVSSDSSDFFKYIYKNHSLEDINSLIKYKIPLVEHIKNDLNPSDNIVNYVISFCPEPGAFLSDETIIIKDLNPYEKDKRKLCESCMLCAFVHSK